MPTNIVLIGMPGSGKSTFGVLLAKIAAKAFIDTDLLIQSDFNASLQSQLDEFGYQELRHREAQVLLKIACENTVIATGGSAVYSDEAMRHLAKTGVLVYLQASEKTLEQRINNMASRGIAKAPEQSFQQLYQQRVPLYEQYASLTINTEQPEHIEVLAEQLLAQLGA